MILSRERRWRFPWTRQDQRDHSADDQNMPLHTAPTETETLPSHGDTADICSGSGKGDPQMARSTIARQIRLLPMDNPEPIGRGRFGKVYRGLWHGITVACKIFDSHDER